MTWRITGPGYQQPWYWTNSPVISRFQHREHWLIPPINTIYDALPRLLTRGWTFRESGWRSDLRRSCTCWWSVSYSTRGPPRCLHLTISSWRCQPSTSRSWELPRWVSPRSSRNWSRWVHINRYLNIYINVWYIYCCAISVNILRDDKVGNSVTVKLTPMLQQCLTCCITDEWGWQIFDCYVNIQP